MLMSITYTSGRFPKDLKLFFLSTSAKSIILLNLIKQGPPSKPRQLHRSICRMVHYQNRETFTTPRALPHLAHRALQQIALYQQYHLEHHSEHHTIPKNSALSSASYVRKKRALPKAAPHMTQCILHYQKARLTKIRD